MLVRAIAEDAMDVINLKISKVGGLTRAKLMRDLCVASGIPMTIEDTWGGDITTAAIAHFANARVEVEVLVVLALAEQFGLAGLVQTCAAHRYA